MIELNCTPFEIMAVTGHRTMKEVERYGREYLMPVASQLCCYFACKFSSRFISHRDGAKYGVTCFMTSPHRSGFAAYQQMQHAVFNGHTRSILRLRGDALRR
jgi:hypothetical protein